VEPGEPPMNISSISARCVARLRRSTGTVVKPAERGVTLKNNEGQSC